MYDLPASSVANLAYFFDFQYVDGRDPFWCVAPAVIKIGEWKQKNDGDLIKIDIGGGELSIVDTRLGRQPLVYTMTGFQRELYQFCDEIRRRTSIEQFAHIRRQDEGLDQVLNEFKRNRLIMEENGEYLGLAIDPGRFHKSDMGP